MLDSFNLLARFALKDFLNNSAASESKSLTGVANTKQNNLFKISSDFLAFKKQMLCCLLVQLTASVLCKQLSVSTPSVFHGPWNCSHGLDKEIRHEE